MEYAFKRIAELENALTVATEYLMEIGYPNENLGQFLALVGSALQLEHDSTKIERWRLMWKVAQDRK
jgi:hypothetical protein